MLIMDDRRVSDVLLIRHLPGALSAKDQVELLKHFGATEVKCCGNKGPLKYCAFSRFSDKQAAENALKRLHQFNILGHTLSAEFSKKSFEEVIGKTCTNNVEKKEIIKEGQQSEIPDKLKILDNIDSISQNWSLRYPFNPKLKYLYPPPSPSILANITSALIAVPKFYVQVLHLMNRMNLSAPFGIVTPAPPLPKTAPVEPQVIPPPEPAMEADAVEMEVDSTEESELETDSGEETRVTSKLTASSVLKRRKVAKKPPISKKARLLAANPTISAVKNPSVPSLKPTEVFEQPTALPVKKIEIKYGQDASENQNAVTETDTTVVTGGPIEPEDSKEVPTATVTVVDGGFGKIEPVSVNEADNDNESSDGEEGEWGSGEFISSKQLRRGRLSSREMRDLSVFRKYDPGEPTTRLYIKNLAKQTIEKDLHYIFGRYVDWENDNEKNMFDIRLMKEGRMKGQCFVTLSNEKKAKQAREDTNGFQLRGKPMVVQFARSAKPKDS